MGEYLKYLLKICGFVALGSFIVIFALINNCNIETMASSISEAIAIAFGLSILYEKILWKINPLESMPRLSSKYKCTLEYDHKMGHGVKKTEAEIRQTLLKVTISFSTDEIYSHSVTGSVVKNDDDFVLCYMYETTPKAKFMSQNPVQYGACRLYIDAQNGTMHGVYWTTSSTVGDITYIPQK